VQKIIKTIAIGLVVCLTTLASAQGVLDFNNKPISLSYYGDNLIHSGIKVGTSHLLGTKVKTKVHKWKGLEKKRGSKIKRIDYTADLNLSLYNHPNNHTGLLLGLGATRLRTNTRKNRSVGWTAEVSYLRRFYNVKTYELASDGTIQKIPLAGNNGLVLSVSPSFGKVIKPQIYNRTIRIYGRSILQVVTYNHRWIPNAAFEFGVTLNPVKI